MREVHEDHNEQIEIGGIVVNMFQERARLPRRLVDELEAEGLPVLRPFINASVKVRESHERHRPLIYLAPSHKVTGQFRELYRTLADGRPDGRRGAWPARAEPGLPPRRRRQRAR